MDVCLRQNSFTKGELRHILGCVIDHNTKLPDEVNRNTLG